MICFFCTYSMQNLKSMTQDTYIICNLYTKKCIFYKFFFFGLFKRLYLLKCVCKWEDYISSFCSFIMLCPKRIWRVGGIKLMDHPCKAQMWNSFIDGGSILPFSHINVETSTIFYRTGWRYGHILTIKGKSLVNSVSFSLLVLCYLLPILPPTPLP